MEKLNQLIAELKAVDDKIDTLLAHDSLTDEQRAEHGILETERAKLDQQIKNEETRIARAQDRAAKEAEAARLARVAANPGTRITTPDLPNQNANPLVPNKPTPGIEMPAHPRSYRPLVHFRGTYEGRSAEQRAWRWGQYILASLARKGLIEAQGAVEWCNKNLAAHSSTTQGGQHLIPEEFSRDMIDLRNRYGVVRQLFRNEPMTSDTKVIPRRTGGLTAYPIGEGDAITESVKSWDQVRLTAKDWGVMARYSLQFSADSIINLGDDLAGEISYAFTNKEDECGFNGDGTSTYHGIVGIRTKLDSIDGAGTDGAGLVAQGTSNTWSAIVLADFHNVMAKLPQYARLQMPTWVCSAAFHDAVMQRLAFAAGGNTAPVILNGVPSQTFLGFPVVLSEVFPTATATSHVACLFGAFKLAAAFGDRQQDSIAFSEHATVNSQSVFERNQIAVRGVERFDINVHDVGTSAVTGPVVGLKTGS